MVYGPEKIWLNFERLGYFLFDSNDNVAEVCNLIIIVQLYFAKWLCVYCAELYESAIYAVETCPSVRLSVRQTRSMFRLYFCVFLCEFRSLWLCGISVVGLVFQNRAKRLAWKNVSEMTYFVSSGTLNLAPSIRSVYRTRMHCAVNVDGSAGNAMKVCSLVSQLNVTDGAEVHNGRKINQKN